MSRQPLKSWERTPEQEAAYQRMQAKCQKNAEGVLRQSEQAPAAASSHDVAVKPVLAENDIKSHLSWERPKEGATAVMTTCKRYSCSKVTVCGKLSYELWALVPGSWFRQLAIGLESFAKAKEIAEQHVQTNHVASAA